MNDMVVNFNVSYSNSKDSNDFSWAWKAPDSVDKIFPLCLKMLFHFKSHEMFLMQQVQSIYISLYALVGHIFQIESFKIHFPTFQSLSVCLYLQKLM